jgi:hypothetical protein
VKKKKTRDAKLDAEFMSELRRFLDSHESMVRIAKKMPRAQAEKAIGLLMLAANSVAP